MGVFCRDCSDGTGSGQGSAAAQGPRVARLAGGCLGRLHLRGVGHQVWNRARERDSSAVMRRGSDLEGRPRHHRPRLHRSTLRWQHDTNTLLRTQNNRRTVPARHSTRDQVASPDCRRRAPARPRTLARAPRAAAASPGGARRGPTARPGDAHPQAPRT